MEMEETIHLFAMVMLSAINDCKRIGVRAHADVIVETVVATGTRIVPCGHTDCAVILTEKAIRRLIEARFVTLDDSVFHITTLGATVATTVDKYLSDDKPSTEKPN